MATTEARLMCTTVEGDPDCSYIGDCASIIVLGASGDLASKMTFPSLFGLYCLKLLPKKTFIYGFGRSEMDSKSFEERISKHFSDEWKDKKEEFFKLCKYVQGDYDVESFRKLNEELKKNEEEKAGRVFYLAIPPSKFIETCSNIRHAAMSERGSTRFILEKPYGRDLESSNQLSSDLKQILREEQIYRIDHYLGKEMVQNLLVLRFANDTYEITWNRHYVASVLVDFKESFGIEGRGAYFDEYGIIRDVIQNHLMQIVSLIGMEEPASLNPADICDEKVKVMRCIDPIKMEDVVVGQYTGYKEDRSIKKKESTTSTFATVVMWINNSRWSGVPFILRCGKGLDENKTDVRIQFHESKSPAFKNVPRDELVIRVSPEERISFSFNNKVPGIALKVVQTELDLTYKDRFQERIPKPYERLIYDVLQGDHSVFVRKDEIEQQWRIFTPLLHTLENDRTQPIMYDMGSKGPKESDTLIEKNNFKQNQRNVWAPAKM